ncbi:MAG: HEAT repeat domain-containing protein [Planctomyces sp.]
MPTGIRSHSALASALRLLSVAALAGSIVASPALAADETKPDDLLRDYIHYVRIARYDLAQSNAQALLDRLAAPFGKADAATAMPLSGKGGLVELIERPGELARFEEAASRGSRVGEIENVSSLLLRAYERGKLEQARYADEIAGSIQMLLGTARQRLVARERLAEAGEYATPQLLKALIDRQNPALRAEAFQILVDMGRQSLAPLQAALLKIEPGFQEVIISALSEIPSSTSLPFLYEVRATTSVDKVRAAAERAIVKLDGKVRTDIDAAELHRLLAERYLREDDGLVMFPGEDRQLLWDFNPQIGLVMTSIDTKLFNEAVAMRLSERSLTLDAQNLDAVSLWVAANLLREAQTPEGYTNPAYPASRRDAMFYAVAAGPAVSQRVLARGLDRRDTLLARRAIEALQRTTGARGLATGIGTRRPLVEALRYPTRRVQFDAALVMAGAQPTESFDGSERVVPILASAATNPGARTAVVLSSDLERGNSLAANLRTAGFNVLPVARSMTDIESDIAAAPTIELVITALSGDASAALAADLRARPKTSATPLVAIVSSQAEPELSLKFKGDRLTRLVREGAEPAQIAEAVRTLVDDVSGGTIAGDDAAIYQTRALAALRDLAISSGTVFNVMDAAMPLVASLNTASGSVRLRTADVLSLINDARVQQALMDAALAAQPADMIPLMNRVTDSAKRFGNRLTERQISKLRTLANTGSDQQATAVAALIGALNLPNISAVPMIINPDPAKN